jgi:acetoin utilization protein AcuB
MVNRQFRLIDLIDDMCDGKDVFFQLVCDVKDMMTYDVKVLTLDDTIATCLKIMQVGTFRHVPIIDKQKTIVGIISDRDVLHHLPFRKVQHRPQAEMFRNGLFDVDPEELVIRQPINRIIKRDVTHVPPDCSFHDAVKLLQEMNISCLPVTDDEKKIIGIVTVTDVMRGLLAAYALLEKAMA